MTEDLNEYERFYEKPRFENFLHYTQLNNRDRQFVLDMFLKDFNRHLRKKIFNFDSFDPLITITDFLNLEKDELEEFQMYEACLLYQDGIELIFQIYDEILENDENE